MTPVPIYLFEHGNHGLPLSLGVLETYVRSTAGSRLGDRIAFRHMNSPSPEEVVQAPPGIWLFPDYVWSFGVNVQVSKAVKARHPRNVTIHGGPSAPKRAEACERFLRSAAHVDVAVRGEGEQTVTELIEHLVTALEKNVDWREGLDGIAGISYLSTPGGEMVRTADRPRMQDLSLVPSPYLEGTMDAWLSPHFRVATVETSRGCPYGCTFCDWGSAILQKIYKFDTDRIKSEIEWIVRHGFYVLFLSDANFGTFDRDVEIAEFIGDMRRKHGFPKDVIVSYAKNGNPRIPEIVRAIVSAGVATQGVISIQTRDPDTLAAIHRSNIKTANYEKLVSDYRRMNLPIATDLMVGLPGSTVESHKRDLQWCIDEDLVARTFLTAVLPNSPMADPEYIRKHRIEVVDGHVGSTATMSREDMARVGDAMWLYEIIEKATLLRYVMRYLQWEHGLGASELLFSMARGIRDEPERFPTYISDRPGGRTPHKLECLASVREDPDPFYAAVWNHVRDRLGIPLGSEADRTVFQLNAALIPRAGAQYPMPFESSWDVLAYFRSSISPRAGERRALTRLDSPERFEIADPDGLASRKLDGVVVHNNALRIFELHWPGLNPTMLNAIYDTAAA